MAEDPEMVPTFFTVNAVEGGEPLGMESGSIPDENITASSCADGVTAAMGRLNVGNSWCAGDAKDCYLQVDCGKLHMVCAVATQGNYAPNSNGDYVQKYQIKHSNDGQHWITYEEPLEQQPGEAAEVQSTAVDLSGANDDAKRLYEAMKGWGTDESALSEILCTRDNMELAAIREVYAERYNVSLEEALTGELSGSLRSLFLELAKGERDQSTEIDADLAESDAKDLMAAGVQAWGTDEDVFIRVFTQRSLLQLSATFSAYQTMGSEDISASLESEMSGHFLTALLTIVNRVQADPVKFYADQIRQALEEGDWAAVERIVFNRSKIQLEKICTSYSASYGTELADDVNVMYHGDNKMAVVEKIDRTKVLVQRIFEGNSDAHSVKRNDFNQPVITRFIRFCPLEWHVWPCMSVELYGAEVIQGGAPPPPEEEVVSAEAVAEVETAPEPVEEEIEAVDRRTEIEEEHRKRMEEIENRIKEQEERRKQELEEKRRAEEEERRQREEEIKRREDEAARKREEERRQLEEERLRWEEERKRREEEVRQMIEEGRKKREEERKKREEEHRRKREEEKQRREEERKARLEEEKRKLEEARRKREEEFRTRMDNSRSINIDVAVALESTPEEDGGTRPVQDERKKKEELWNKKVKDPLKIEQEMKQLRDEERKRLAEERRKREEEEAERKEREREITGELRAKIDDTRPERVDDLRVIEYRLKAMEEERRRREEEELKREAEERKRKKEEEDERLKALTELAKKTDEQREILRKQREEEEKKLWEEEEARRNEEEKRRKWLIEERGRRMEEEKKKREEEADLWRREMERKKAQEEEENKKKEEQERIKNQIVDKKRLEEIERKGLEAERRRKREEEQRRRDEEEMRKREEREKWRKKQVEKRMSGEMVRRRSDEDLREREKREEIWEQQMAKRHSKNFENKLVFITGSPQKEKDTEEIFAQEVNMVMASPVNDEGPQTTVTSKRTVTVRTITTTVRDARDDHVTNGEPKTNIFLDGVHDHDHDHHHHDHDNDHDSDDGRPRDWYRRSCCDHLLPLDPAVQDAVESSFFSRYDDVKPSMRPMSWHGALDLGSALHLPTPDNPIDDAEVDKLLTLEQENQASGWKRVKKSRGLEILRKPGNGPVITKAVMTLPGIPYQDAVNLLTDWSERRKWDSTFDRVEVVDEMGDSKVLNCVLKNKYQLVLATREREENRGPFHAIAWQKTVYPGTTTGPKMSPLRLDTMTCGAVIRPYYGQDASQLTVITQLRGNAPSVLKNTYLTGSPSKWLTQLKKYHSKQYVERKPARLKDTGNDDIAANPNVNVNA